MESPVDRRSFLAGIGVLGALGAAGLAAPSSAQAAPTPPALPILDIANDLLADLSVDVYKGLAAFVVPGDDEFSRSQGTESAGPGGVAARTHEFLIDSLDNYVPFPDRIAGPLASALSTTLDDVELKLPLGLDIVTKLLLGDLEKAIKYLLNNDETLPLSTVIALVLNTQAVRVDPSSAVGTTPSLLSPFARLSFAKKAAVFELLEGPDAELVKLLDSGLPEPFTGSISGLLQFVAGALLEFSAFGTFSEWTTFDPEKLGVTSRPIGWDLAKYDPGSVEGWDEFKGYYQGRKKVSER